MLVLTSESMTTGSEGAAFSAWHGPRVLALLPGSGLSRRQVRDLATSCYVVDFLQRPETTGALLNDVLTFLQHEVTRAEWPLVYLAQPLDKSRFDALAGPAVNRPHEVGVDLDGDRRLTRLTLGEMVVTSPLLLDFFSLAATRKVDDLLLAELLHDTFSWDL